MTPIPHRINNIFSYPKTLKIQINGNQKVYFGNEQSLGAGTGDGGQAICNSLARLRLAGLQSDLPSDLSGSFCEVIYGEQQAIGSAGSKKIVAALGEKVGQ